MKIKNAYIKEFKIPFKKDILGQGKYKEGLYFICETDDNKTGIGELSTYFGLHSYHSMDLKNQLDELAKRFKNVTLNLEQFDPHRPLFNVLNIAGIDTRLLFCVESALLDLIGKNSYFNNHSPKIQALIIPNAPLPTVVGDIVKVKIGKIDIQDEINLLKELPCKLRLDSNSTLKPEIIRRYWSSLGDKIDFFEDPFEFSPKWKDLALEGIPLALDEDLAKYLNEDLSFLKNIIIKPNLFEGIHSTLKIIDDSEIPVIISSTFESKIGINTLKKITQYKGIKTNTAHGLGTLSYLENH
ncbi:MAG: hypothetical protein ACO20H_03680 [Bacteriovoracaceae bacterium]